MKTKLTTFGGGLFTGLLLVLFLSSASREKTDPEEKSGSAPPYVPEIVDGFKLVPIDTFYQDVARYRDRHVDRVKNRTRDKNNNRRDPSRMFIYSVPTMEKFFMLIKAAAHEGKLDPDKVAIRFYYGVYPRGQKIAGEDYSGLHTLFMVPNYWSAKDGRYRDIAILQLAAEIKKYEGNLDEYKRQSIITNNYVENLFTSSQRKASIFMLDASAVPYLQPLPVQYGSLFAASPEVINQGQLCPPNCSPESLLDVIDEVFPPGSMNNN